MVKEMNEVCHCCKKLDLPICMATSEHHLNIGDLLAASWLRRKQFVFAQTASGRHWVCKQDGLVHEICSFLPSTSWPPSCSHQCAVELVGFLLLRSRLDWLRSPSIVSSRSFVCLSASLRDWFPCLSWQRQIGMWPAHLVADVISG